MTSPWGNCHGQFGQFGSWTDSITPDSRIMQWPDTKQSSGEAQERSCGGDLRERREGCRPGRVGCWGAYGEWQPLSRSFCSQSFWYGYMWSLCTHTVVALLWLHCNGKVSCHGPTPSNAPINPAPKRPGARPPALCWSAKERGRATQGESHLLPGKGREKLAPNRRLLPFSVLWPPFQH